MRKVNRIPKNNILFLSLLLFGIFFFLFDILGILLPLRYGISFVAEPLRYQGNTMGYSSRTYLETLFKMEEFRKEYNEQKISMYEKDVANSFYSVLKEENESLKKQISLSNEDKKYVLAKVLRSGSVDKVILSEGSDSGIAVGDTVSLGKVYVGNVLSVDKDNCTVRLPSSKGYSLEILIIRGEMESVRLGETISPLTRGVTRGSEKGILVENMSMNADLQNGDLVVVNDPKVGEYLVLGYLVGISDNPANTSRSGFVSPVVEYDNLMTVFVRVSL